MGRSRSQGKKFAKRRMKIPYLGKVALYWCDLCNVPLLENYKCEICHSAPQKVVISPPGDVRPAFVRDIELLQEAVNRQYGSPLGGLLFPFNKIILLNRIGGLDRTDEVIIDGVIAGLLLFNIINGRFEFQPRIPSGKAIISLQTKHSLQPHHQIQLNSDSIPYIFNGKSVLAPGVESVDSITDDIEKDDYLILTTKREKSDLGSIDLITECIGIGIAKENSQKMEEILKENHGVLAKNKSHINSFEEIIPEIKLDKITQNPDDNTFLADLQEKNSFEIKLPIIKATLQSAYRANYSYIQAKIEKSIHFIKNTIETRKNPVAVAYSGGKDSLGTLLLVWKAIGPNFKIFFANTGLELPEVLDNVHKIVNILGMADKYFEKNSGDHFWEIVQTFGPPGRDFRYCCHSLKAQPIMELINSLYGGQKVLSFLGQRQYESFNRSKSPMVYTNSFIPLQISATPIKKWNALLLWLFLLYEPVNDPGSSNPLKIPITPLYFKGHERLGCYLCPAANLGTFSLLKETHPDLHKRWFDYLESYSEKYNLPSEWVDLGLWRFKHYAPQWRDLINKLNIDINFSAADPSAPLEFQVTKGFSPCLQTGYSVKGRFSEPLNLRKIMQYIPAFTDGAEFDNELNVITIKSIYKGQTYRLNIFPDGSIFLLSPSQEFDSTGLLKLLIATAFRAHFCNQCKTCISVCPQHAIQLAVAPDEGVRINPDLCSHCTICLTHCPLFQVAKKSFKQIE
ncbi:MAG: phosphoadenosine phosphosulfate reductase domain-containing protein [Promethearchaeota archaeon]